MKEEDWQSSILSTHTKALNRQVTEAVLISENGGGGRTVKLLNSKQEFGAEQNKKKNETTKNCRPHMG